MYCRVSGCTFSDHHITPEHVCGTCGLKGHGVWECGKKGLVTALQEAVYELIPLQAQCCVKSCKAIGRHTSAGHMCTHCKQYGHDAIECPDALWETRQARGTCFGSDALGFKKKRHVQIQARNKMGREKHKIYTKVYAGMGCWWVARRSSAWDKVELMYLHNSDEWGVDSTGGTSNTSDIFQDFVTGFRPVL